MHIPTEEYFAYALAMSERERQLGQELLSWLPNDIIDAHAHACLPEHVVALDDGLLAHMMTTFPSFTLDQSALMQRTLFAGKRVHALRFSTPYRGIDLAAANEYLLAESPIGDRVALCGVPTDVVYTCRMLSHPRVSGLKMYYQFFNPPATRIYEVFPRPVLEEASARGIPIILHLPRMITRCLEDLETLLRDFPRLPVVLAHLGLPHLPVPGLADAYVATARHDNVFMDTAMIPSAEVVGLALNAFGWRRILYGSDQPVNLVRAAAYHHPMRGERLAVAYRYHWADPEEQAAYGHLASEATLMHWQALGAVRAAIDELGPSEQQPARTAVFHDNAAELFGFL